MTDCGESYVSDYLPSFKVPFILWSRVPETTLPPIYPGRANFSPVSLKNSTNHLQEDHQRVSGRWDNSGASCLTSTGRVSLAGGTTFSHIITLSRLPETTSCVPRVTERLDFGLKTTKSTNCILKKKNLHKQRLQWSNQRKILKEKGVLRSWISMEGFGIIKEGQLCLGQPGQLLIVLTLGKVVSGGGLSLVPGTTSLHISLKINFKTSYSWWSLHLFSTLECLNK